MSAPLPADEIVSLVCAALDDVSALSVSGQRKVLAEVAEEVRQRIALARHTKTYAISFWWRLKGSRTFARSKTCEITAPTRREAILHARMLLPSELVVKRTPAACEVVDE